MKNDSIILVFVSCRRFVRHWLHWVGTPNIDYSLMCELVVPGWARYYLPAKAGWPAELENRLGKIEPG